MPVRSVWRRANLVLLGATALFLLLVVVNRRIDHDEHQFIAAAWLLARRGLIPHVDFAWFHVPYLILPYAALFRATGHLLLAARLVSATFAFASVVMIWWYASRLFRHETPKRRTAIALGFAVLLLGNPLFAYTSGLVWNHDSSVALGLAATLTFILALRRERRDPWMLGAGVLLGLAVGTRLSFLPVVLPFVAGAYILSEPGKRRRERLRPAVALGLGLGLALLPLLPVVMAAPDAFLFDNFGYAALNTAYREATAYPKAMTFFGKALFFLTRVVVDPGNLFVLVLLALIVSRLGLKSLVTGPGREIAFLLAVAVFACAGSFAPTPSFVQYFYAPLPFLLLATARGLAAVNERAAARQRVFRLFAITVAICALRGVPEYWKIFTRHSPDGTTTGMTHRVGSRIREMVKDGPVLTLAPLFPLAGGLDIYPQFATGPFAWRTAPLLTRSERRRHRVIAPADLDALLSERPAAAILVGTEPAELEGPLIDFARRKGYRATALTEHLTLWVPPRVADVDLPAPGAR